MVRGFSRLGRLRVSVLSLALALAACATRYGAPEAYSDADPPQTYSQGTVVDAAEELFGETTAGLADVIHTVFNDQGAPEAYIAGEEASGAFAVGLRYGKGMLHRPGAPPTPVYWRGPSIGWDAGGNASKVFTLVYNLGPTERIYRRFPGVDGSFYFFGGLGVNYQHHGGITLAPIRTGVGLRAGASVGYLHYDDNASWAPF